jgi:hypothetical protein
MLCSVRKGQLVQHPKVHTALQADGHGALSSNGVTPCQELISAMTLCAAAGLPSEPDHAHHFGYDSMRICMRVATKIR